MSTSRYTVVHLDSYTGEVKRVVCATNKRKTAFRAAAHHLAGSRVAPLVEVRDRRGVEIEPSRSLWKREVGAAYAAERRYRASRVVWR